MVDQSNQQVAFFPSLVRRVIIVILHNNVMKQTLLYSVTDEGRYMKNFFEATFSFASCED